jgi:hypothetical protein
MKRASEPSGGGTEAGERQMYLGRCTKASALSRSQVAVVSQSSESRPKVCGSVAPWVALVAEKALT